MDRTLEQSLVDLKKEIIEKFTDEYDSVRIIASNISEIRKSKIWKILFQFDTNEKTISELTSELFKKELINNLNGILSEFYYKGKDAEYFLELDTFEYYIPLEQQLSEYSDTLTWKAVIDLEEKIFKEESGPLYETKNVINSFKEKWNNNNILKENIFNKENVVTVKNAKEVVDYFDRNVDNISLQFIDFDNVEVFIDDDYDGTIDDAKEYVEHIDSTISPTHNNPEDFPHDYQEDSYLDTDKMGSYLTENKHYYNKPMNNDMYVGFWDETDNGYSNVYKMPINKIPLNTDDENIYNFVADNGEVVEDGWDILSPQEPHGKYWELSDDFNMGENILKENKLNEIIEDEIVIKMGIMKYKPKKTKLLKDFTTKSGFTEKAGTELTVYFSNKVQYEEYIWFELSNGKNSRLSLTRAYLYFSGFTKPPSLQTMEKWDSDGYSKTPTGKKVEPDGTGPDGSPSWLKVIGVI